MLPEKVQDLLFVLQKESIRHGFVGAKMPEPQPCHGVEKGVLRQTGTSPGGRGGWATTPSSPVLHLPSAKENQSMAGCCHQWHEHVNHAAEKEEESLHCLRICVSTGLEVCEARLNLPVFKAPYNSPCRNASGLAAKQDAKVRANLTASTCLQTLAEVAVFQMLFSKGRCWCNPCTAWCHDITAIQVWSIRVVSSHWKRKMVHHKEQFTKYHVKWKTNLRGSTQKSSRLQ